MQSPNTNRIESNKISIDWKIGVEIELISPKGMSRYDLVSAIAYKYDGKVRRFFFTQFEPSKVSYTPIFNNLTLGFEAIDSKGELIASCVDDLTLQDDFDKSCPPKDGWYKIVSDVSRLIQLIIQQCNPKDSLVNVLEPNASLFKTEMEIGQENMVRVAGNTGAAIAIVAPLTG